MVPKPLPLVLVRFIRMFSFTREHGRGTSFQEATQTDNCLDEPSAIFFPLFFDNHLRLPTGRTTRARLFRCPATRVSWCHLQVTVILPLTQKRRPIIRAANSTMPGWIPGVSLGLTLHTFTWLADHTALVVFVLHTGVSTIDYRLSRPAVEQSLHSGSEKCYGMTLFLGPASPSNSGLAYQSTTPLVFGPGVIPAVRWHGWQRQKS
jgi:hypothetical protein